MGNKKGSIVCIIVLHHLETLADLICYHLTLNTYYYKQIENINRTHKELFAYATTPSPDSGDAEETAAALKV